MRRCRTAVFALVLGAAATAPAAAIGPVTVFGLKAPEEVAGYTLNDSTNLEKGRAGDGYSLDYTQPGWKLDVFVYDLKRAAIPEDAGSAIVRAEFERSREEAFLAAPRGMYAQVYLRRNFTIDEGKRTRFQCATFFMRRDGAKPQDGFLCVTSWNNKFVKLRLTTLSDKDTEATARKHVAAWIPILWGSGARVERAEQPRPQAAPPPHRRAPVRRFVCPQGYICR